MGWWNRVCLWVEHGEGQIGFPRGRVHNTGHGELSRANSGMKSMFSLDFSDTSMALGMD